MNLKEAFRFQNKLTSLIDEVGFELADTSNITKTQNTLFINKVIKDLEDLVTTSTSDSDYANNITELTSFLMFILEEKEKLFSAIRKAKAKLEIDIDSETALNAKRQDVVVFLKNMNKIRASEKLLSGEGTAYTFNTDGNQVPFKCDIKKVTTINFDRNKVRAYLEKLNKLSDETSQKLDMALVTTEVDYTEPFDVNSSLLDIFEDYLAG